MSADREHIRTPGSRFGGAPGLRLALALALAAALGTAAGVAALHDDEADAQARPASVRLAWEGRDGDRQVLGGALHAGVPTVQRLMHERLPFTVTVAPARPGRNLVRVDTDGHRVHNDLPVFVGTDEDRLVRARPRPGTDGLWAEVDLPAGEGTVLVTHGPSHRIPFTVETGQDRPAEAAAWLGADGPECVSAAVATLLAGQTPAGCAAGSLEETARAQVADTVEVLADRGVEQVALIEDDSARSRAAADVVRRVAADRGLAVAGTGDRAAPRSAVLVVSGWEHAATALARLTRSAADTVRTDGTWLAPWLLTPAVVDSTPGVVLPLDFDIRSAPAQRFAATLGRLLPGQAPTATAYAAWRGETEEVGAERTAGTFYAASRTSAMPASMQHAHGVVPWFPGGTVTPVAVRPTTLGEDATP